MAFSGKYELESQENYEAFLEAMGKLFKIGLEGGFLNAKTDYKVVTEVVQEGQDFSWSQKIPNWTWTNRFTIGQECELETMFGTKFKTTVTMEGGKLSIQFPQYLFTAHMEGDKLVMLCTTPGEKGVIFTRINRRL